MTETFGVAGMCLLAGLAVGVGIVGLAAWFGPGDDDDDDWEDWLPDEEDEEGEDGDR